jgi:hypothetical protein
VIIGDTRHSKGIFTKWSLDELNALGIYTFTEDDVASLLGHYNIDSSSDTITDGNCHRTHTLTPKYNNSELRRLIKANAKSMLRGLWSEQRKEKDYLLTFDPTNTKEIEACQNFIDELVPASILIKADIQEITSYDEGFAYLTSGLAERIPTQGEI